MSNSSGPKKDVARLRSLGRRTTPEPLCQSLGLDPSLVVFRGPGAGCGNNG